MEYPLRFVIALLSLVYSSSANAQSVDELLAGLTREVCNDLSTVASERLSVEQHLTTCGLTFLVVEEIRTKLTNGSIDLTETFSLQELQTQRSNLVEAQRQTALLNQQVAALRSQLGSLQALLDEYKSRDESSQIRLQTLGRDLNAALARAAAEELTCPPKLPSL